MSSQLTVRDIRAAAKVTCEFEDMMSGGIVKTRVQFSADVIEILLAEIDQLVECVEWYAGNFNGKDGTRWSADTFFIEDKFGVSQSAGGPRRALEQLKRMNQ